jgi:hypothetical protein
MGLSAITSRLVASAFAVGRLVIILVLFGCMESPAALLVPATLGTPDHGFTINNLLMGFTILGRSKLELVGSLAGSFLLLFRGIGSSSRGLGRLLRRGVWLAVGAVDSLGSIARLCC